MISPIMKMICRQEACRDARLVRPLRWECKSIYIDPCVRARRITSKQHGCWSECTRHFERTHGPCVPTCARATHHMGRIDYQRLTPCVSISAISPCNMADFTAQSQSFYASIQLVPLFFLSHRKGNKSSIRSPRPSPLPCITINPERKATH